MFLHLLDHADVIGGIAGFLSTCALPSSIVHDRLLAYSLAMSLLKFVASLFIPNNLCVDRPKML